MAHENNQLAQKGILSFLVFSCVAFVQFAGLDAINIDVMANGAVGDGKTDDSQAFLKAFGLVCAGPNPSTLLIPSGKTFLLRPITFQGPCTAPSVHIQISGNIVAPGSIAAWQGTNLDRWITFVAVNGLTIDGSGQIDGQGSIWWTCKIQKQCSNAPKTLSIFKCNNFQMSGLRFINSGGFHVGLDGCIGVRISTITITAPQASPNTDGIHLQSCQHVNILHSNIGTGDDCISIGTGTSDVNITEVTCGPGHGISVGSLGLQGSVAAVEQIHVTNSKFVGTQNGARIKTWQGGSGFARDISFENLNLTSVDNPIIIDQYYCNGTRTCTTQTSAVQVSNVRFVGIHGTTTNQVGIKLACSQTVGCTNIHLGDIVIQSTVPGKQLTSTCINAHGTHTDPVTPSVPCLA